MKPALALALVLCSAAQARPRVRYAEQTAAPEKPASALLAPEQLIDRAERLFATLDFDQMLPIVRRLIADPSLPTDIRVRALALEGSTLAVTADVADAERPFRKLLRLKPDFELPPKSPPKILAAFRKVQTEERQLAEELETSRRQRQISRLKLLDELPGTGRGGRALKLSLRVFDPDGAVAGVRVPYRKAQESTWQVLALQRDETGAWSGAVPGEVTAAGDPYTLQLYVETVDSKGGALLVRGSQAEPLKVEIAAGSVRRVSAPKPLFVVSAGLAVVAWGVAGVLGLELAQAQASLRPVAHPMMENPSDLDAAVYDAAVARGNTLALACNVTWISAAALTAISAVIALFVDWSDP